MDRYGPRARGVQTVSRSKPVRRLLWVKRSCRNAVARLGSIGVRLLEGYFFADGQVVASIHMAELSPTVSDVTAVGSTWPTRVHGKNFAAVSTRSGVDQALANRVGLAQSP